MSGYVPRLSGSVAAGFPSPAEQYLGPPLDLNQLLVRHPASSFFVRVQGDSMVGKGILDGDILVVDRSFRPASGDVIIAAVNGEFTVKTLRIENRDGSCYYSLEPANPEYQVITVRPGETLDYFGKVVGVVRRI